MEFNVRDSVKATVVCSTSKGVYLTLENGSSAYAHFNRLPTGTAVYCTILKNSTDRVPLVAIDAVTYTDLHVA